MRKFGLLVCVFFDDFPVFEFEPLQRSTSQLLHSFFDCLGWLHATLGKKAEDFSQTMTVLGVTFDLSQVWGGNVKVANKAGRLDRIQEISGNLAQTDEPSMHDISVLQGLLNFAGGFVAGRAFKPILHFVQQIIRSKDFSALKRLRGYINEHLVGLERRATTPMSSSTRMELGCPTRAWVEQLGEECCWTTWVVIASFTTVQSLLRWSKLGRQQQESKSFVR